MRFSVQVVEAYGLFVCTNVDDLLLLVAWSADERISFLRILSGQLLGIGGLLMASVVVGSGAARLPPPAVHLLGVVPLALGLFKLREAWRARTKEEWAAGRGETVFCIALVTLASGGDNVAAYVPAFAAGYGALGSYALVFAVMTVLWCVAARGLVRHPLLRGRIDRVGAWLTPAVLVAIGLLVLRPCLTWAVAHH